MKFVATRINVQAPIETVWRILTDLPRWIEWNSTVERTLGTVEVGAKVTVFVKLSPGRAFPLRVTELRAPHRMVWGDGMPFGLFKGVRVFELSAPTANSTVFNMREDYTGLLAGLICKSIPDMQPAFEEFVQCLKRAAESR